MEKYDYYKQVTEDVLSYIEENDITITEDNKNEIYEQLYDDLWVDDSVTGNGSGSYTFNAWTAEEYLCHNFDLYLEALRELGSDFINTTFFSAEIADVTIRCYILGQCISEAIEKTMSE